MLVLEHAFKHDEFLTTRMGMRRKLTTGRISHDRRGPRDFIANPVQHPPIDARHGRGLPWDVISVQKDGGGEISIQVHAWQIPFLRSRNGL